MVDSLYLRGEVKNLDIFREFLTCVSACPLVRRGFILKASAFKPPTLPAENNMEITLENENNNSSPNLEFKGAHQAFRDRWKETDDTMCRHSMSFHLHHKLQSDFFASYLYLLEKTPLGKRHRSLVGSVFL
ncbi:hypothetical protein XENOCAPTIV_008302 [Xenoophorus captivus]|uniref:Uncharacterized protein n=1 Tax=Xenoophorus captivus TaxID=1517983 RepID=A0ABV0RLC1_9TELE